MTHTEGSSQMNRPFEDGFEANSEINLRNSLPSKIISRRRQTYIFKTGLALIQSTAHTKPKRWKHTNAEPGFELNL